MLASSGARRRGSDYQHGDSDNWNLDRLERGPKFWLGGSECGELTVKTSSSPSSPSFWSAVEEVVEPAVSKTAINPSSADLRGRRRRRGAAYLRPGPRWLSARLCRTLWRRPDSERTSRTSCPPPSSGETWDLRWCTRGPSSADSPGSPVGVTQVSHGPH